jgi:hypothetical protein
MPADPPAPGAAPAGPLLRRIPADLVARARAAAAVRHPHLVPVLDAGVDDAGGYALVRPPADAVPLDELVRELGPLPDFLAAEYGRQAADALRAAHERGLGHGDVRPGNLLVGPVAAVTHPDGTTRRKPAPGATAVLAGLGLTPGPADPADDLRGLGGTLYHLLAGRPPAPPLAPLPVVRPDLPPAFAGLVHRLLSDDPADRPGTAAEVEEALAGFGHPAQAPDPVPDSAPGWRDPFPSATGTGNSAVRPVPRRVRTPGEKARIWVLLLLGLVLNLAAIALAVAWWTGALDPKPEPPPEPAGQPPPAVAPKKPGRAAYRYVRYLAPAESWGNIAEFEAYGTPAAAGEQPLIGEVIGTDGSWGDEGNTRDRAFDGDLTTYFDAPEPIAEGAWVGLDLGSPHVITRIRYAPRAGFEERMVGGRFQASNTPDFSAGVVELYTITVAPPGGVLTARTVGPGPARAKRADPDPELDEVRD